MKLVCQVVYLKILYIMLMLCKCYQIVKSEYIYYKRRFVMLVLLTTIIFTLTLNASEVDLSKGYKQYKMEHISGYTIEQGSAINGLRHGKCIRYFPNGNKQVESYFDMGKREGSWKHYNLAGKLIMVVKYNNDNPVSVTYKINQ